MKVRVGFLFVANCGWFHAAYAVTADAAGAMRRVNKDVVANRQKFLMQAVEEFVGLGWLAGFAIEVGSPNGAREEGVACENQSWLSALRWINYVAEGFICVPRSARGL